MVFKSALNSSVVFSCQPRSGGITRPYRVYRSLDLDLDLDHALRLRRHGGAHPAARWVHKGALLIHSMARCQHDGEEPRWRNEKAFLQPRLCDSHPAESLKSGSTIDKGLPFKQIRITAASLSVHSIRVIPQHPIPCHFRILYIHQRELHNWAHHH